MRLFALLLSLAISCVAAAQDLTIGIIDFYGLQRTSSADARAALALTEGGTFQFERQKEAEARLTRLPSVLAAHLTLVCCDSGRWIVYVGIEERDAPSLRFQPAPTGPERLPADVVDAGKRFEEALVPAVQNGRGGEDRAQGHALSEDPAMRAVQERFIEYARRDVPLLRRVLSRSSDAAHRALAAQVLGYVVDKQAVVNDLVGAMRDPDENVRNNAMRALLVFTSATPAPGRPVARVPYEPFVDFLDSPVWSDRNKASLALGELSRARDPKLLDGLRARSLGSLVEMARWKSTGHAAAALLILARVADRADTDVDAALASGNREGIIAAALATAPR